jgi:hypothetical protein
VKCAFGNSFRSGFVTNQVLGLAYIAGDTFQEMCEHNTQATPKMDTRGFSWNCHFHWLQNFYEVPFTCGLRNVYWERGKISHE